jgi:hypothetical protein
MQWDCRLSTGLPPATTMLVVKPKGGPAARNWDRRAVWDQVGLSHCRYDGVVTVRDEARIRRGHNDPSCQGHQCSKTMQTGESRSHKGTPPRGLNPGPSWREANGWTTGPLELCMNAVRLQALHNNAIDQKIMVLYDNMLLGSGNPVAPCKNFFLH